MTKHEETFVVIILSALIMLVVISAEVANEFESNAYPPLTKQRMKVKRREQILQYKVYDKNNL